LIKIVWKSSIAILLSLLLWVLWPIYGFVSNQFEIARIPFGWHSLPDDTPITHKAYDPKYADIGKAAIEILAKRREQISAPSLSAAITVKGKLVWAGTAGWKDVANKKPATLNTAYRIGSTSKAVSTTALARLVDDKTIDLDAPISNYIDKLPNTLWAKFTSRQLASHTAGLVGYEENNDWIGFYQSLALTTRFDNPQNALSVFDNADTLFEAGTDFHYSSFDNILLSAVMQSALDIPFNEIMMSYVFTPLGLTHTYPDHMKPKNLDFAKPYQTDRKRVKLWRQVDLSHKLAAGGYISTPTELATLGAAWLDSDFISKDIRDIFWTPVTLVNGSTNEQDYALGFRRKSWPIHGKDVIHLNHGGVSKGSQCWLMIIPEHNISLAITINRRTDQFFDFADVYVDLLEVFIPASGKALE